MPRNNGYNYNAAELKEILKSNPGFKLNKNQILKLFPDLTSNFIKHYTSPRCKEEHRMPCDRRNGKPVFIFNQVDAYLNPPKKEQSTNGQNNSLSNITSFQSKKGKKGKISKIG